MTDINAALVDLAYMDLYDLARHVRESADPISPALLAAQLDNLYSQQLNQVLKAGFEQKRPAPTVRVRINVTTSVKGVVTTDTTLEHFGDLRDTDLDAILELRQELSAKVDAAYPPPALT